MDALHGMLPLAGEGAVDGSSTMLRRQQFLAWCLLA
jgi:hypothetical protein